MPLPVNAGAVAMPLELVTASMAALPPVKVPLGPLAGAVKRTTMPLIGCPAAFVTLTWNREVAAPTAVTEVGVAVSGATVSGCWGRAMLKSAPAATAITLLRPAGTCAALGGLRKELQASTVPPIV